jgi:hypothetical protein
VRSAGRGVQIFRLMPLALASEGQGTWDLTDFSERRIHSAFGRANLPVSPI